MTVINQVAAHAAYRAGIALLWVRDRAERQAARCARYGLERVKRVDG